MISCVVIYCKLVRNSRKMGKLVKTNRYILNFYWKFVTLFIICCSIMSSIAPWLGPEQWLWGVCLWDYGFFFSIHRAKRICSWVGWELWKEEIIILPVLLASALAFFGTARTTVLHVILMCHYSSQMPWWLLVHGKSKSSGFCCLSSSCCSLTLMYTVF